MDLLKQYQFIVKIKKGSVLIMKEYDVYPVSTSNQITEGYYYSLIEQINNGTCSKEVSKILKRNGSREYFTYHLISTM